MKKQKVYRLLPMVFVLALFFICITGPAVANQESDDAKVLRQFGEEIVKNNPTLDSASNLEKAKAGFVEYLKRLSASNARVSNDVWGRIHDKLFADERTAFTCSVHTLNLQDIFKGMGISSQSIGQIGGEMDTYNPLNVNSDHGAVLIRDNDGKEYVFDAWAHATMRDTMSPLDDLYGEGETSPFNGMPKNEWKDQMREEGYTRFFEDGFLADPTDNVRSPATSLGRIIGTKGAFVSRGNIMGGTDHLGFANCLCRCGCSQAGWACGAGVACVYDANPKGECLCAGYGEGHVPVPSSGECYDGCAKEYHITGMLSNKTPLIPANSGGNSAIMPGDLIQTTGDTVISLKDGSKLLVKAGSILNFTSTESGKVRVNLLLGSLRTEHAAGGSAGAGGPEVQIANATVQPEGTEFICQWDGSSGKVSVVEGSVSIADETSEETLKAGEEMALPAGAVSDYNLSADDGGLVAGIPLRDLILDEGEPEPFGEYDPTFEDGNIPDDWAWQDPGSDAKRDFMSSGSLIVTVPDGNEFWGYPGVTAGQRSEAPRLLHKVTGDFDLQGRVYLDTEATDLATVEFLYYSPGSNIGLESGLMKQDLLGEHYNLPGGRWLRAGGLNKLPVLGRPSEVTYTGNSAELKSAPDAPDEPVFLKFTRRGNVLRTYHSYDGENWILSSRSEVNLSQTIWAGWVFKRFAYDGLTDENAVVTLDDVNLKTAESGSMPVPEWDLILQAGSAEVDGDTIRLIMDGSGKGVTGIQKGAALVGDFEATVGFQTEDEALESGESRTLALTASNYNGHNSTYVGWTIDRNHVSQLYTTEYFSAGHAADGANDYTDDWSGRLRIVRQDGNISTYFWKDGDWKVLGNFQRGYPDPVYIGLKVSNEREATGNASMAVDFTVDEIAGNVSPSTPFDASEDTVTDDSGTPEEDYVSETDVSDTNISETDENEDYENENYENENDGYENDASDTEVSENDGVETGGETYVETGEETSVASEGETIVIFDNSNIKAKSNNPSCNPRFTITSPHMITYIDSYHWNNYLDIAEVGTIWLVKDDGTEFGPWQAECLPGMSAIRNSFWMVYPYTVIPAGTYEILSSDRETWAQNSASGGCGISAVHGYPV